MADRPDCPNCGGTGRELPDGNCGFDDPGALLDIECGRCGGTGRAADRPDRDLADRARALLAAATPGPWTHPSPTSNWFTVPQPIQIDEADWGQETQEGGAMCGYRIGTLADERAWRYADIELIAAAPDLIAGLLTERDEYRRQLDTLRNAIGDTNRLRLIGDAGLFGQGHLHRIADAVDALAAVGDPEDKENPDG